MLYGFLPFAVFAVEFDEDFNGDQVYNVDLVQSEFSLFVIEKSLEVLQGDGFVVRLGEVVVDSDFQINFASKNFVFLLKEELFFISLTRDHVHYFVSVCQKTLFKNFIVQIFDFIESKAVSHVFHSYFGNCLGFSLKHGFVRRRNNFDVVFILREEMDADGSVLFFCYLLPLLLSGNYTSRIHYTYVVFHHFEWDGSSDFGGWELII